MTGEPPQELFLTRQQVREVDRLAVQTLGMPSIVLMENAARNTAQAIMDLLGERAARKSGPPRAVVLCGGGNNGGDGYAIARHLVIRGVCTAIVAAKAPQELGGDAATNCAIAQRMGLKIAVADNPAAMAEHAQEMAEADVIVDALLGTGFSGQVRPPFDALIARCNAAARAGVAVVSVDVPSGLDCDTGQPAASTVEATMTVTFVAQKVGFRNPLARRYLGRRVVADIGTPPPLIALALGAG